MTWIKTYEAFIYEAGPKASPEVETLEKILKLPNNSGIFSAVAYDKTKAELHIEQPKDLNPMDAGAVMSAINKEKPAIKKEYKGIRKIVIGDLQISI
jgi:hypothetical protein